MEVINSFKVCMNMDVTEYMAAHPEFKSVTEVSDPICEKFITEMSEGSLDEISKFFGLDPEDEAKLTKDNFAIGYKAVQFNEEEKFINVNFKLDIRTDGPDLEGETPADNGIFDIGQIANMMANMPATEAPTDGNVIDTEAKEVTEEGSVEETHDQLDQAPEIPVEEATEVTPTEE